MQLNSKSGPQAKNHEGSPAYGNLKPMQQLRRTVMSCMLWEDQFYEDGKSIADRIEELAAFVSPQELAALAIELRTVHNLRHVSLLLLKALAKRGGSIVGETIYQTIQRADELSEFLAIYWNPEKQKLSKQVKVGLARAFRKFNEYNLAKYDRAKAIRLRDVLFLVHAKPRDEKQAETWKRLVENKLITPDTWEVALSGGADKKETFTRLVSEGKLGYLALLRNLRNMEQAGVDPELMKNAILARKGGAERVLPFRYIAAARACPSMEKHLDQALLAGIKELPTLSGSTIVLVDVSGSMSATLSAKSDLTRLDAAATLASIIGGNLRVFTFSSRVVEVPQRFGMAGVDAIRHSQPHSDTQLAKAMAYMNNIKHDRLIVLTDEQNTDGRIPAPKAERAYMVNVASYKNGIGYGKWIHIDGFSENILRWIHEQEKL